MLSWPVMPFVLIGCGGSTFLSYSKGMDTLPKEYWMGTLSRNRI
jgi:hypothetical protein